VANDYLPKFKPGQAITWTATGTVTPGLLVNVAGTLAGANDTTWLGVADRDAVSGQQFGVYMEGVQRLTAAAAISAGARVKCAASGQVTTLTAGTDAYDTLVGIALEAAAGSGSVFAVKLLR
jgi:predicted RecA/RadA family phage recombinase